MVALLNEVYGDDFITSSSNVFPSEFYESHTDMIEDMSDEELYHSYQSEIKKAEKKEQKKIETFSNAVITCHDIESHFNNCTRCQKHVKSRFCQLDDSKKKIIDIVIFILLGILLLFILDIFVRLGKMLK